MKRPLRIVFFGSDGAARFSLLAFVYALLFVGVGLSFGSGGAPGREASRLDNELPQDAQFVGSGRCSQCHASEHSEWLGSQHKAAMQEASEETVLGDFGGAPFSKDGVQSTFFKRDSKFWVRTDGPDGKLADFEIRYTFGVAPLQQYLIELPGGRMQAFGIAWDARSKEEGGQRWYHLYPDRKLVAGDPLHWTGIDQNWNYQCAYCHSTNLQKNYQSATGEFKTTWSEISVGCESCHGPASNHIAWATKAKSTDQYEPDAKGFALTLDERRGVTWPMGDTGQAVRSVPRNTAKEGNACAGCHARRQQFSDHPGDVGRFVDAFRPSRLEAGLYHADGQQRDEVYTYGSFIQSKMHAAGVTCSDCHNPHSGKLRLAGNAICGQCHAPERFDTAKHHQHASDSKGAACVSCHMPTTTYMGVDARHDHSMRIPRPDRTIVLATPNACNQCHTDKSATWARDAIKGWYPSPKPGAQEFAEAFDRGDRGAPGAQGALLEIAQKQAGSAIVRASAIARLARFASAQVLALAAQSLTSDDPSVQSAAISVIAGADPATRRALLVPVLTDKARLVRMDAARALAGERESDLPADGREALEAALAEYVEAQLFNSERPEAHANLGALYRDRGQTEEARLAFEKAIRIDPTFFAAAISLADLLRTGGNETAAESILIEALKTNPNAGPVQHALGLSLIRQKRTADAMVWLARAAEAAPDDPRFSYVLAIAHHDSGQKADAIGVLKNALTRHPYDRDLLWALASYESETGNYRSALERAELLSRLEPDRADVAQMVVALRQAARPSSD